MEENTRNNAKLELLQSYVDNQNKQQKRWWVIFPNFLLFLLKVVVAVLYAAFYAFQLILNIIGIPALKVFVGIYVFACILGFSFLYIVGKVPTGKWLEYGVEWGLISLGVAAVYAIAALDTKGFATKIKQFLGYWVPFRKPIVAIRISNRSD